jgi:5-methylcytosine-specific restriction endonuclease McrA
MTQNKQLNSFFSQFSSTVIFEHWHSSKNIFELAQKLGLNDINHLTQQDLLFIQSLRTGSNWRKTVIGKQRQLEKNRYKLLESSTTDELQSRLDLPFINSLNDLAIFFLVSPRHGRSRLRQLILDKKLNVKSSLYKGVHGVSEQPLFWPTSEYEKRKGSKSDTCTLCGFKAQHQEQIELHHPTDIDGGPKKERNPIYYKTKELTELCANCHSLEHRTGDHLFEKIGVWRKKLPGNQKYKNPDEIFTANCTSNYRVQKDYFLKWHLQNNSMYKCNMCGTSRWGKDQKFLALELDHIDQNHSNTVLNNLQLLCPNCHRYKTAIQRNGEAPEGEKI